MGASITVRNVGKGFHVNRRGNFVALRDVSFDVRPGEFLVLVGPSGCGKTTLLDLIAGLTAPDSGSIAVNGKPVTGPGLDRGIVFQQYALFPWKTALGNVEFGLEAAGFDKKARRQKARNYLRLVGLDAFEEHYPHQLSGGMKQRVAIARALSYEPEVLLMDEPFAALDAQTRENLQDELLRLWKETGKTVLFITHGIEEAVYLGQRVLVMGARPGRIVQEVEVDIDRRDTGHDLRATPEFVRLRHQVWELIHHGQGAQPEPLALAA